MNKITPVIMTRSLDVVRGGVTKASIKRANTLAKEHKQVIICTFVYQQYHNKIIKKIYDEKILSNNVKVLNFFEDTRAANKPFKLNKDKKVQNVKEKNLIQFKVQNKKEPSYRYYQDGKFVKYKRYNIDNTLKFVDYFDSNRYRLKRIEYDEKGIVTRVRHMDYKHNTSRLDRYFNYKGQCYLSVRVNPKNGKNGLTAHFLDSPVEHETLQVCQQLWFNKVLSDIDLPVVSSELRGLDPLLINAQHNRMKKIAVVHTSHLKPPYDNINQIKPSYNRLMYNAKHLDHIVFLTNEQKTDVEKVFGTHDNFSVIPHSSIQSNKKRQTKERHIEFNSHLAVTLARYHEDKRLDEAIKAFQFVVEKIPKAEYHIYGYGVLKNDLESLIKQLNLEKNVFLKEYSKDAESVYKSAACSILTSRQEGFAMVLTESMGFGTPVVSYNIKYGPSDIIDDGFNGYLVQNGDKKQLAEKIVRIMQDRKLRNELSNNALYNKEKYSEIKYKNKWLNLFGQ